MTRLVRFSNNAVSQLAANLTISGTSLSVTPGDGAKFPSLSAGQYFMATLVKADGSTEVVKVTARSTDTLTIARAAEPVGGASTSYSFSAGDRIEARLTAGVLGSEIDRLDNGSIFETLNKSANYTVVEADVTTLIRVSTASGTITITLPQISSLTDDFDILVAKVTSDANSVVIQRSGTTDLINGATSTTLFNQYQSAWVVADRSTNTWTVIGGGLNAVNTVVDAGTGSGSATITLSGDPGSKNNTALFIGGVYQQKATYSISGTTLTAGGTIGAGVGYEVVWSAPLTIGTPADGTVGTVKIVDAAVTTAKIADANVTTAKLAANAVTYAKMQSVSAGKVLGRDTSGAGVVQELPIAVDSSGNVGINTSNPSCRFEVSGAGTLTRFTGSGAQFQGFGVRNNFASATNAGSVFYDAVNENNATVANMVADINTDGSSAWYWATQTAGARTDRRVETMRIDTNRNLQFNSGYGSAATAYGCRAWVNFDGNGPTIRGNGNVSSISRPSNGKYIINFSNAMPDTNYAALGTACFNTTDVGNGSDIIQTSQYATGSFYVAAKITSNGGLENVAQISIAVFR